MPRPGRSQQRIDVGGVRCGRQHSRSCCNTATTAGLCCRVGVEARLVEEPEHPVHRHEDQARAPRVEQTVRLELRLDRAAPGGGMAAPAPFGIELHQPTSATRGTAVTTEKTLQITIT